MCYDLMQGNRPLVRCSCNATYHLECRRKVGGCTTLGCLRQRPLSVVRDEAPPQAVWQMALGVCLLLAALLTGSYVLTTGAAYSDLHEDRYVIRRDAPPPAKSVSPE